MCSLRNPFMAKTYNLEGWVPLGQKSYTIEGYPDHDQLNKVVTEDPLIRVYLDPDRCNDDSSDFGDTESDQEVLEEGKRIRRFYKKYKTKTGCFTVKNICKLIHKTYWKANNEIFNGNTAYFDNLAVAGFVYNKNTKSVYPQTDS